MSAEDDYVKGNLDTLREMQLSGMSAEERVTWQGKIDNVKKQYDEARAIEKDEKRSADERKQAKDQADAIAKAAPAITKSLISAVNAFRKGDAINGSADIMDICASLAPVISTFLSAAGPVGAIIGAFFSIIGQILRCFGPKQESDVSKLMKYMDELRAQDRLEDIKAVHNDVLAQGLTLLKEARVLARLLAKPLDNHDDYLAFTRGLDSTAIILGDTGPHKSVAMFEQWKVLEYLKDPKNQDVPLWPTVLGIYCKTYSDLVTSTMTITAMTNTDDMQARLNDVAPDSTSKLSDKDRHSLEKKLVLIQAYGDARQREYESCNQIALEGLKSLTSVARQWGLYAHVGTKHNMYVARGPKNIRDGDWTTFSDSNYYHRFTLFAGAGATIRDGQASSEFNFKPDYHCFVLKSNSSSYPGSHHFVDHMWVNADKLSLTGQRNILDNFNPAFTDICAGGETDKDLSVFGGVAAAPGSVVAWKLDAKDNYNTARLESGNWWPGTKAPVTTARVAVAPVPPAGDPDGAGIPAGWKGWILYGSMRGSTEVYVNESNRGCYIPGPADWGPSVGIAVDENYLWYYQPAGFAVVSHASVMKSVNSGGKIPPRWLHYPSLPQDLRGLVSLSPCEDGTILIAANPPGKAQTIQTAPYEIDIAKGTVKVGDWTKIRGEALHVQKLPMPGWSLFKSLTAKLT